MKTLFALISTLFLLSCATVPEPNTDAAFQALLKDGFKATGIAGLDRLQQDEGNAQCSDPAFAEGKAFEKQRKAIEAANLKTVVYPSDGKFIGDWKAGEAIAQSGRGMTWTDDVKTVNGGNCYNCHQIDQKEISHGTLGPSLHHYGKLRGTSDDITRYTWAKLYNAKAFNACSNMPRLGHKGVLNQKQLQDLMALLLDPQSPVNQ
jgi:L-cysteine S-thiosulfotransferase